MFILQITLHRHNARLKLNYCPLSDPPNCSLPSTFKPGLNPHYTDSKNLVSVIDNNMLGLCFKCISGSILQH
jgi:hypothetical protein